MTGMPFGAGLVLDRLDARASELPLARDAAHVIRRLLEEVSLLEIERDTATVSWMAYAVEIDRMKDHRAAFLEMRGKKAGKR